MSIPLRVKFMILPVGLIVGLSTAPAVAESDSELEVVLAHEAGPTYVLQNDGEYGATGTRYGASDVGQNDNLLVSQRTSLELRYGNHRAVFLYAPFDVTTEATLTKDIQFRDKLFSTGTLISHRYLFEGYRASYLYRLINRGPFVLEVGGSLQIRNAEVAFRAVDGNDRAAENDIGLVTAAKARLWYRPTDGGWWSALEADGFSTFGLVSGVKGGIYDVQLMAGHPITRHVDLVFGARLLGGGADVESKDIYNWANFMSFTVGARLAFGSEADDSDS